MSGEDRRARCGTSRANHAANAHLIDHEFVEPPISIPPTLTGDGDVLGDAVACSCEFPRLSCPNCTEDCLACNRARIASPPDTAPRPCASATGACNSPGACGQYRECLAARVNAFLGDNEAKVREIAISFGARPGELSFAMKLVRAGREEGARAERKEIRVDIERLVGAMDEEYEVAAQRKASDEELETIEITRAGVIRARNRIAARGKP